MILAMVVNKSVRLYIVNYGYHPISPMSHALSSILEPATHAAGLSVGGTAGGGEGGRGWVAGRSTSPLVKRQHCNTSQTGTNVEFDLKMPGAAHVDT